MNCEGEFYLVKGKTLLRVASSAVFVSWKFSRIVWVEPEAIAHYLIAGKLGFRDGTVLKGFGSRKVYLVSEQKTRHVTDPETLAKLGVTDDDYFVVSDEEVAIHKEGEPLGRI